MDGHGFLVDMPNGAFGGTDSPSLEGNWRSWLIAKQTLDCVFKDSHDPLTVYDVQSRMATHGITDGLDLLFIDADHTYEGVKADYLLYKDNVKPGGLIVFHDIIHHPNHPTVGVDRFWNELKADPLIKTKEFVENPEQGWAGIGMVIV